MSGQNPQYEVPEGINESMQNEDLPELKDQPHDTSCHAQDNEICLQNLGV